MPEVRSIKELVKDIDGLRDRDIPYIAETYLNNWSFDIKKDVEKRIPAELSINKKKLLSPVRVKKASKRKLISTVYIKEDSWQYRTLKHHFFGGDRDRKGLEKALIYNGFMSSDEILTPPPGVSIRPSTYVKMIAQLRVSYKSGYDANETKRSRKRKRKTKERYFVIGTYERSHLHAGVYARMPDHDRPISILRIVKRPKYKKRLDNFEETVHKLQDTKSSKHLQDAMDWVLKKNKDMGWI